MDHNESFFLLSQWSGCLCARYSNNIFQNPPEYSMYSRSMRNFQMHFLALISLKNLVNFVKTTQSAFVSHSNAVQKVCIQMQLCATASKRSNSFKCDCHVIFTSCEPFLLLANVCIVQWFIYHIVASTKTFNAIEMVFFAILDWL